MSACIGIIYHCFVNLLEIFVTAIVGFNCRYFGRQNENNNMCHCIPSFFLLVSRAVIRIQSKGASRVIRIQSKGASRVIRIQSKGASLVIRIQSKGASRVISIQSREPRLSYAFNLRVPRVS